MPSHGVEEPLVVLAWDAADPDLVDRWVAEGALPNLAALRARGAWLRMHSPASLSSGATWPSLYTGCNPGKHGMYFGHWQLHSGSYRVVRKWADCVQRPPFWVAPSQRGRRILVADVPFTALHSGFRGVQLVSWGAEAVGGPLGSQPAELAQRVVARFGRHPLSDWYGRTPQRTEEWKWLLSAIRRGVRTRTALFRHLLEEPVDLFMGAFAESHWVAHYFWHLMDREHPEHDPALLRELGGDPVRSIYRELDTALGELLAMLPPCTFLLVSNTGMGSAMGGSELLPDVLERLGMGPHRGPMHAALDRLLPGRRFSPATVMKRSPLPRAWIQRIKKLFPRRFWAQATRRLATLGSEWPNTRAFAVPNDLPGAIRVNLRGREPRGRVEPADFDAVCDELARELRALVHDETGRPVVSEVLRTDRWCHGPHLSNLPDLTVRWTGDFPVRAVRSPRVGTLSNHAIPYRSGEHRDPGFLLATGARIRADVGGVCDVTDVAPTLLHLLGEPVDDDLDGRILQELWEGPTRERAAARRSAS